MKYAVVVCRGENLNDRRHLAGNFPTPHEAGRHREWSGDLVIDVKTGKISADESWLFDWERRDPQSFARRMQRQWS